VRELSSKCMRTLIPAVLAGLLAVGCGDDDDDTPRPGGDSGVDGGRSDGGLDGSIDGGLDGAVRPTDAGTDGGDAGLPETQIVDVTTAANSAEIMTSQVALTKAQSDDVQSFAQDMIQMHGAAQTRQELLATTLGVTRQTSPQGDLMRATTTQIVQQLQALPQGPAFDLAYVNAQVTLHSTTLQTMDQLLLPSAQTPALRQELTASRAEVATHLTSAQTLLAALQTDGGI